jgi:predicted RNA-binding protein with PIN domain
MIVVDAMNVIGSVPDGWWRDRDDGLRRLVDAVTDHEFDEWVVIVADGHPVVDVPAGTRGDIELRYAGRSDRDAADDDIVALLADLDDDEPVTVVTSDRGLIDRVRTLGAAIEGARSFRERVGW